MLPINQILHGDCLDVMSGLPGNSIDLIVIDPPYFRVKGHYWDRQWEDRRGFIAWIGELCEHFRRLLKPNGSLYCFASPKHAAAVEMKIEEYFNILNRIAWVKTDGTANEGGLWCRADKSVLRRFFEQKEEIIFAEHYGADNIAKGEAGYVAKCDELRGFVFEPLRAYLASERDRAGVTRGQIDKQWQLEKGNKGGMSSHWFSTSQWELPTAKNYQWLRETFSRLNGGGDYLQREYDDLRREYDDLRREYDDLRRPFSVTPEIPYTDVWRFKTVNAYPGKHPCEKPLDLMAHIIQCSSKPGAVVLDCFAGSGSTLIAAGQCGRNYIGIEKDAAYYAMAVERVKRHAPPEIAPPCALQAGLSPDYRRGGQLAIF